MVAAASLTGSVTGLFVGLGTSSPASAAQSVAGSTSGTAGQEVTVDELSSTKYEKAPNSISKSAITKGERVLVLGTVSSTTINGTAAIDRRPKPGSGAATFRTAGATPT